MVRSIVVLPDPMAPEMIMFNRHRPATPSDRTTARQRAEFHQLGELDRLLAELADRHIRPVQRQRRVKVWTLSSVPEAFGRLPRVITPAR